MKLPIDAYVGSGWDQLLSLVTLLTALATAVSFAVITWLRFRLRKYFVAKPEHQAAIALHKAEHEQNLGSLADMKSQLEKLEQQHTELATKHNLNGLMQRQESLNTRVSSLELTIAGGMQKIDGVAHDVGSVKHLMTMVLEHLIRKDPA